LAGVFLVGLLPFFAGVADARERVRRGLGLVLRGELDAARFLAGVRDAERPRFLAGVLRGGIFV